MLCRKALKERRKAKASKRSSSRTHTHIRTRSHFFFDFFLLPAQCFPSQTFQTFHFSSSAFGMKFYASRIWSLEDWWVSFGTLLLLSQAQYLNESRSKTETGELWRIQEYAFCVPFLSWSHFGFTWKFISDLFLVSNKSFFLCHFFIIL